MIGSRIVFGVAATRNISNKATNGRVPDTDAQMLIDLLGQELELDRKPFEADVRKYAKHILTHGTKDEKREVLGHLKSRIELRDKGLVLRIGSGGSQIEENGYPVNAENTSRS